MSIFEYEDKDGKKKNRLWFSIFHYSTSVIYGVGCGFMVAGVLVSAAMPWYWWLTLGLASTVINVYMAKGDVPSVIKGLFGGLFCYTEDDIAKKRYPINDQKEYQAGDPISNTKKGLIGAGCVIGLGSAIVFGVLTYNGLMQVLPVIIGLFGVTAGPELLLALALIVTIPTAIALYAMAVQSISELIKRVDSFQNLKKLITHKFKLLWDYEYYQEHYGKKDLRKGVKPAFGEVAHRFYGVLTSFFLLGGVALAILGLVFTVRASYVDLINIFQSWQMVEGLQIGLGVFFCFFLGFVSEFPFTLKNTLRSVIKWGKEGVKFVVSLAEPSQLRFSSVSEKVGYYASKAGWGVLMLPLILLPLILFTIGRCLNAFGNGQVSASGTTGLDDATVKWMTVIGGAFYSYCAAANGGPDGKWGFFSRKYQAVSRNQYHAVEVVTSPKPPLRPTLGPTIASLGRVMHFRPSVKRSPGSSSEEQNQGASLRETGQSTRMKQA